MPPTEGGGMEAFMSILPNKKGDPDIYAKYDKKREQVPDPTVSGVKIFGYRSGAVYKMLLASLYYFFAGLYIVMGIVGEIKYLSFEPIDVVLSILKYAFWIIMFFSPLIFLSDFKYRETLPFFKKRDAVSSFIGILLVWMFCYFMANVNIYCMSNTYKNSLEKFTEQQRIQRMENSTTVNTTNVNDGNKEPATTEKSKDK